MARGNCPFEELFKQAERDYEVPASLLQELTWLESGWNPQAVGDGGLALGLGQIHKVAWDERGIGEGPWRENAVKPEFAIPAIARYLLWLRAALAHRMGGPPERVGWTLPLIAYNWGIGNVLRWLEKGRPIPPIRSLAYAAAIISPEEA